MPLSREVFKKGMAVLSATWPEKDLPPAAMEAYKMALEDLSDAVFSTAVKRCLKCCTFFPKPAEILKEAADIRGELGEGPPCAEIAWTEVQKRARYYSHGGATGTAGAYSHDAIKQAVEAVGGLYMVMNSEDNGYIRERFIKAYEVYRQRQMWQDCGLGGPALVDRINQQKALKAANDSK